MGSEITAIKVATLSCLAYSHFHLFFAFKETFGKPEISRRQRGKNEVTAMFAHKWQSSMTSVNKKSYPGQAKQMPW
jgi:hypothetical protein